ncbi:MAG: pyridoxamine 5'-phosphate oxidase family protein [Chloroflexi bacterium]|uniref:pyridoxamine 5'-phosphate oxidase family protein n=1 Tax=Candidatus Flexifilum breve TaxID=3140694 RepID=UPI00313649C8|nr:pyridoxamine 5'-phosphate oxidase family protein [Chloroflexota bacterium]
MSRDYAALPPNQVRRSDRAVTDEAWIAEMLTHAPIGTLATVHEGQPFINSNLFVYDAQNQAIYTHTAQVGRTRANVEGDAKVCFSVSDMGRLLPADEALEFSVEYSGVVVFGRATLIEGEQAERALQMLLDKYFPHLQSGRDYRPITLDELKRTSVFQISIDSWSGKRKQVEDEFPGAFFYGQHGERLVGTSQSDFRGALPLGGGGNSPPAGRGGGGGGGGGGLWTPLSACVTFGRRTLLVFPEFL